MTAEPRSDRASLWYLVIAVLLSLVAILIEIQNIRSMDDRHQINERLKTAEARSDKAEAMAIQTSQDVGYMRRIVEEAVSRDAARQKARDEATKKK